MVESLERGLVRVQGFNNAEMDHQLLRQLGSVRYGGASVGECLALAASINDGDPASWVAQFAASGQRQLADARARHQRGHLVSARDQYLCASNSLRAAEYLSLAGHSQHRELGMASRTAFLLAMQCAGVACEELWFELDGARLPAYYLKNAAPVGDKTLLIISGYDGTLEETYTNYGRAAAERGYHLLLFTGPGQMDAWRFNEKCLFVPDMERIGAQVVDYLCQRAPGTKIALMGISFGGYFAARIAAFEPRIQALIPNSPIVDLHAYMRSFAGIDPDSLGPDDDFGLQQLPQIPAAIMPELQRVMAHNLIARFGASSFVATYQRLKEFALSTAQLAQIRCPALALVGAGEGAEPIGQWRAFAGATSGPCDSHMFGAAEGGDAHCQAGNLALAAAVALDWLDERFD